VIEQGAARTVWQTPDGLQALSSRGTTTNLVLAPSATELSALEAALATS
jgi:hypothetical protein